MDKPYHRDFSPEQIQAKREYARAHMAKLRASARDIKIHSPRDPERRLACEQDPVEWMRVYCKDRFYNPFTGHQEEIIRDMVYTLQEGGDKALADIRGGGKTTMTEAICGGFWNNITPKTYGVIISKNGPNAKKLLNSIKSMYEHDLCPTLAQDYPEICVPIQKLEGWASRGKLQTVNGTRTQIIWTDNMIQFPLVHPHFCIHCYREFDQEDPVCQHCGELWGEEYEDYDEDGNLQTYYRPKPSRSSKNCLASFGIDAAFVGLKQGSLRPTYAVLDDVETEDSALSPDQVDKKERIIDNSVGGLAGPTQKFSRIMLCTVRGQISLAANFTDPQVKPSWRGKRYSQVQKFPENEQYWKEYMLIRKRAQQDGDASAKVATDYYLENREMMDEGVEVLNPYRKDPGEHSAIQHFYNKVSDRGWAFVIPEYQNQIYIDDEAESQLPSRDFLLIKHHPLRDEIVYRTGFVDVSKKVLWWMVCGWTEDFSGKILDYGIFPEQREYELTKEITEVLPGSTEDDRLLHFKNFSTDLVKQYSLNRMGVDVGWRDDLLTPQTDSNMVMACRGQGATIHSKPIHEVTDTRPGDLPGVNWRLRYLRNDSGRYRVLQFESDFWKSVIHDKLSAAPESSGTLLLPAAPFDNRNLTLHLLSEKRNLVQGRYRRFWMYDEPTGDNHWLDCLVGCTVLASTLGLSLTQDHTPKQSTKSWKELAEAQRQKMAERQSRQDRDRKMQSRRRSHQLRRSRP